MDEQPSCASVQSFLHLALKPHFDTQVSFVFVHVASHEVFVVPQLVTSAHASAPASCPPSLLEGGVTEPSFVLMGDFEVSGVASSESDETSPSNFSKSCVHAKSTRDARSAAPAIIAPLRR